MPADRFKLPWWLILLGGVGIAATVFYAWSPPPPPATVKNAGGAPTVPEARASPPDEFLPPRRHRKKSSSDGGVETEADFFGEIREWARRNPEAALAWAQSQPDSDDARKEALTDACFQIVQTDPERAVTLAQRFNLNRDAVLSNLAQQWATRDLTAAGRWVAAQPEGDARDALVQGVTLPWSRTDPAAAARFVVEEMSPGAAFDATVTMVVHQWAASDPDGAAGWVRRYPAGPLQDRLLEELGHAAPAASKIR